ncbi:MAG: ABC transporter permease subunit [Actinomycetota bacterium]
MNVFLREFKAHRKGLIWWSVGMFFLVYSGMAKFDAYQKSGVNVTKIFDTLPKAVKAVLGVRDVNLSTAIGFFVILFIYLIVMASIHAALLGAGVLTEEELDRTTEFLFAKPISRAKAVAAKLSAALLNVTVLNLVTTVSSVAFVAAYNRGESATTEVLLLMGGMYLAQLLFLSAGLAAAAIIKRPKRAAAVVSAYLFSAYFLSLWLDVTEKAQWLKYATPFKYFDAATIVKNTALNPVYFAISVSLTAVLGVLAFVFYQKRDLNV